MIQANASPSVYPVYAPTARKLAIASLARCEPFVRALTAGLATLTAL
jgi:hypothetical protein